MRKLGFAVIPVLGLTGCASHPTCPGPEVVEVERVRYIPVPPHLTAYSDPVEVDVVTNGDLLEAYKAWRAAAEERARLLDEVAKLR